MIFCLAAALLAKEYLSAVSADPLANQALLLLQALLLQLGGAITSGAILRVLRLLPQQAPVIFWLQLLTTTSTMGAFNMALVWLNVPDILWDLL